MKRYEIKDWKRVLKTNSFPERRLCVVEAQQHLDIVLSDKVFRFWVEQIR